MSKFRDSGYGEGPSEVDWKLETYARRKWSGSETVDDGKFHPMMIGFCHLAWFSDPFRQILGRRGPFCPLEVMVKCLACVPREAISPMAAYLKVHDAEDAGAMGKLAHISVEDNVQDLQDTVNKLRSMLNTGVRIGVLISDLTNKGRELNKEAELYAGGLIERTNCFAEDAAENYHRLGDYMEDVHRRGGLRAIGESQVFDVTQGVVSRWASARESVVAAKLAVKLAFSEPDEHWSPQIFEEAMENDMTEMQRQSTLLNMAGMVFKDSVSVALENRRRRDLFAGWRADALAPAKAFCKVVGVTDEQVDAAADRAVSGSVAMAAWAVGVVKASAVPVTKVMLTYASGAVAGAALFAAAGYLLDLYYEDVDTKKLGPERFSKSGGNGRVNSVNRVRSLLAIGAAQADENYDVTVHTQVVRADPFFFSLMRDVARMKEESAAQRMVTNAVLAPLLQTISTKDKTVISLPATISEESARHIQDALPEFYFRVVNRSHSHPETWAVRRAFEIVVARQVARADDVSKVVMVGGNVRQVSKIPNVVVNYGPDLTGRDEARKRQSGTLAQRQLYSRLNLCEKFGSDPKRVDGAVACAFYSTQGMTKEEFAKACIKSGIFKAYISMNIPVIMMDNRVNQWDDDVLRCRYKREGKKLYMTCLNVPVPGYTDSAEGVLSWVKPITPIHGYSVEVDTLSKVGSSYLFEMRIGIGPQEEYETIWAMPDAGHYVLHDLTRDSEDMHFYTVPAQKFNQTVRYVVQLSGAKNVVESTAGRMLGLEAQVRIGGNTLERSWSMDNREFVSTMIHAIMCAGLGKSDALLMMANLRSHFSGHSDRSFWQRVATGYRKMLGLQKDNRKPGRAARGASDYDVVTHWTSRQGPGGGFAEPIDVAKVPDSKRKPVETDSKPPHDAEVPVDEGYCSADQLNSEDAAGASASDLAEDFEGNTAAQHEGNLRWATKIFGRGRGQVKQPSGFPGWKYNSRRMMLDLADEEVRSIMTSSVFDPMGLPNFGVDGGSLSNQEFVRNFGSLEDFRQSLREGCNEVCAPDSGLAQLIKMAFDEERKTSNVSPSFFRPVNFKQHDGTPMAVLQEKFFSEVGESDAFAIPALLLDGIAGSAKSSTVRSMVKENSISCAVVCPTKKLAAEWAKTKTGTTVTRHKLMTNTLRGRSLLIIDECYAYTKAEIFSYLWKAAQSECKVLLLGDRRQQYEDGGEVTSSDFATLGLITIRLCVSNTMPVDATKIARWAGQGDDKSKLFQTRSKIVHSICFAQKDSQEDVKEILEAVASSNCLVFKDRAEPLLQFSTISDSDCGFPAGQETTWASTSRVQGTRTEHAALLVGRFSAAEKWFVQQPGLFYVATSRHSVSQLIWGDQFDLNLLEGLSFSHQLTVEGRLALLEARERIDATMTECVSRPYKESAILEKLYQSGATFQAQKFRSIGSVMEDWRPWHKFSCAGTEHAKEIFKATTDRLIGSEVPYVMTDAVKKPTYQAAQGLHSIRRPEVRPAEELMTDFPGLSRLAVLQHSKDELLDQKNVIERTARPRTIDENPWRIRVQADALYAAFKKAFLKDEGLESLSFQPSVADWSATRTAEFISKLVNADFYGVTSFSTRSAGFLKTQTKVKLKRTFALEENYGQTVLASPADFNAKFGEWSKLFLRNLRLCTRRGVILDSGYSDKEVAREFRKIGALGSFQETNYQADVKRQDTSHTPVTLRVFCMLMRDMGVPEELCDLYEIHSAKYEYASMHSGLYRGEAKYNLGSGDPFTLIRNIVEVLTVMLERFGEQLNDAIMIVKGDDFLCNKIMIMQSVAVPEIRATQLTEDYNKPPYHAGRFFTNEDVVPDPVRMVAKILVKRTDDLSRANQLAESFYDRYIHLSETSYNRVRLAAREAYSDFEPEFVDSAIELYHAMRDRQVFYDLLVNRDTSISEENKKLVVLDSEEDCAVYAAGFFIADRELLKSVRNEPKSIVEHILVRQGVPVYEVRGRQNDFLKRGVWLSEEHAWAVIGLTEYKELKEQAN